MENDLVKALEQIKTNIGEDVFLNSNRMNGLLSDLLPSARRDRKIILRIIDAGVMKSFLEEDIARAIGVLRTFLYDEEFMASERAEFYISVLAEVFDHDRSSSIETGKSDNIINNSVSENRLLSGKEKQQAASSGSAYGAQRKRGNMAPEKYVNSNDAYLPSTPEDAFKFSVKDNECSVKSLREKKYTEIKIPEKYQGKPVTSIGDEAFIGCKSLTSVMIPSNVTTIGTSAFSWCERLTSVAIPLGVTTIGEKAFWGCESLVSVSIPSSMTIIRARAFYKCKSLTSITIPSSMTTIGEDVFGECSKFLSISVGTTTGNGRTTTRAGGIATGIDTTKSTVIYSPMKGRAVKLEDVPDEAFASGLLGSGVAIDPSEGKLYAPFDGTVAGVFNTKHAYTLVNDTGAEMLIHIGLDTVKLNGKYFTSKVSGGQKVRKGDLLAEFDLNSIRKEYRMFTPILLTNAEEYSSVEIVKDSGPVKVGDVLYTASIKQEEKRNLLEYRRKQGLCSYCGGAFKKGLFSTKCRNCGRKKDY